MSMLFRTAPSRFAKSVVPASPNAAQNFSPVTVVSAEQKAQWHAQPPTELHSTQSLVSHAPRGSGALQPQWSSTKGVTAGTQQMRFAHSEVTFPDYNNYRRDSTKDPTVPARESEDQRRAFTYATYGVGSMIGIYMGKSMVRYVAAYKSMPADQLAMASVEVNVAEIPEGTTKTVEWRGKPVFVRHRTQAEIDKERAVDTASLRDPQHDDERVRHDPAWVVTLGVCTHLGCVPIAGAGDFGGYYCPCHGSHYDTGGRIRKGPAPENLEVPEYSFPGDGILKIGE